MKKSAKILIGVGIVILALIMSGIGSYNNLVTQYEKVESTFSQIDNQLQRRNDLIPNLVETVKKYATYEEEVFTDIADARSKLLGAGTPSELAAGDTAMNSALSRLLAITENYPELKANQNFIQLQDELAGTENRIATARKDYNDIARDYNTSIRRFPTNIYANVFRFDKVDYFEADENARENPDLEKSFGE